MRWQGETGAGGDREHLYKEISADYNEPVEVFDIFLDKWYFLTSSNNPILLRSEENGLQYYSPYAITRGEISSGFDATAKTLSISLANVDGIMGAKVAKADPSGPNSIIIFRQTFRPNQTGADGLQIDWTNPLHHQVKFRGVIDSWLISDKEVTLECIQQFYRFDIDIPPRTCSYFCGHIYRDEWCRYAGDERGWGNLPWGDIQWGGIEADCPHTLPACAGRLSDNSERYGGFPYTRAEEGKVTL